MAEINLGKVKMTDAELQEFVRKCNGGFRFDTDDNGNDGYYKFDEEAGADTFFPFKKGGGGETSAILSPYVHIVKFSGVHSYTIATNIYTYFPVTNVSRLVLKSLSFSLRKQLTNANNASVYFEIQGKKNGASYKIKEYSVQAASTSNAYNNVSEVEFDLSEIESIEYVRLYGYGYTGTSYQYIFNLNAEFELYF